MSTDDDDSRLRLEISRRNMRQIGVLFVVALLIGSTLCFVPPGSSATSETVPDGVVNKSMTSTSGVEYSLAFDTTSRTLTIEATNPTDESQETGIVVGVDEVDLVNDDFQLSPGESWSKSVDVTSSLDALRTEHLVRASTFGADRTFTFEYDIDPENSSTVPTPYISKTEVSEANVDGESSTVVNVTVVNPSSQRYPTKLMVHTEGTDGSLYLPTAPPGGSTTISVELLDDSNAVVVGEARLYVDEFEDDEGGIDQVGFEGTVDGDTTTWNESYEAVAGPWSDDPYQYRNASVGEPNLVERASGGHELRGIPAIVPAVGGLVLVGVVALVRRRR